MSSTQDVATPHPPQGTKKLFNRGYQLIPPQGFGGVGGGGDDPSGLGDNWIQQDTDNWIQQNGDAWIQQEAAGGSGDAILLESGDTLLLESGDRLLLEA